MKWAYEVAAKLPADERYGLVLQIRRAAASIPANIAEGCGRNTDAELRRYLFIARGSLFELQTHILLALDLAYLTPRECASLIDRCDELGKRIHALASYLHTDSTNC